MKIKDLLQTEDYNSVIAELKSGRTNSEPKTEQYKAQLDPEGHDVNDRVKRPDKKVKVDRPESLENSLQVTNSEPAEEFKPEPVARIALALQKLIVKRAVAFAFGNPVLLNAEPEEGTKEEDVLKSVNRVLFDTKTRTINRKVARNIFSCTEAAERWYPVVKEHDNYGFPSKFKLRVAVFSPLLGDKLYPYFDETGDMVAFSREFERKDKGGKSFTYFETFTDKQHIMWVTGSKGWEVADGYPRENTIGKIPIIYGQQPQVEWEDVQGIIDRLEKLLSNFADTNDYHAAPKIFITGEILGFGKKGESGAVIEGEEGATAQYLAWQNAPESVKLEIETLLNLIYTISQTPDISFDAVKGIGAISGVALKLLFMDAHLKVQDKMEIFDDYLQRRLIVIQSYLAEMNAKDKAYKEACRSLTIEPEIVPFMIDDEKAKVDLLLAANGQKPIASQKTTVQQLGWTQDVDAEYEQIKEEDTFNAYNDIMNPAI